MARWLPIALVVATALAGCGGKAAVPVGIPVDEDGDPLPTVEGFVVDEAIRPMAGVTVRILGEGGVEAFTDVDGHYALVRPTFVAENVLVSAAVAGYVPRSAQVQASGYTSARVDFRLEPDPYQVAHVEVLQHTGSLNCQIRSEAGTQMCSPPNVSTSGIEPRSPTSIWSIDTTKGLAGAIVEIHWDAETPFSEQLHAVLRGPVAGGSHGSTGEVHDEASGASPLRLELPEDAARAFPDWTALWVEVSLPDAQPQAPFSMARAQTFEVYASLFYVDPAPEGYTLG